MAFLSQELHNSVYEADDSPPEIDEYGIATTASDHGTNSDEIKQISQDEISSNILQRLPLSNLPIKSNINYDKLADETIAELSKKTKSKFLCKFFNI